MWGVRESSASAGEASLFTLQTMEGVTLQLITERRDLLPYSGKLLARMSSGKQGACGRKRSRNLFDPAIDAIR